MGKRKGAHEGSVDVKKVVRERYGEIARTSQSCCAPPKGPTCGCGAAPAGISRAVGYSEEELKSLPEGADLGLGCGNPVALASLKRGETVVDLGSGAGIDCFLAAEKVGPAGKVIGVDMTPDMLDKARGNARKGRRKNVEFRLGEIENLPVADASADAVISNCVINLSTDKERVFREVFRVLRPGGRLMVSDIVLKAPLPPAVLESVDAYVGCIAGAALRRQYLAAIRAAGFRDLRVLGETAYPIDLTDGAVRSFLEQVPIGMDELRKVASTIISIKVEAKKPLK
ncbi:MAG: arsenite methyltransferase [Euryarchaeota archaeon]|nr:arsenite methyltransferase [Euryarchaeota archaeon]